MLFNSYMFLFAFLPITLLGFVIISAWESRKAVLCWLVACSIVFYGIWNPINLAIIFPSIAINYYLALAIRKQCESKPDPEGLFNLADILVLLGIIFNLAFLGYFKYKNFFLGTLNDVVGTQFALTRLILPLGISFITFQKIGFLVDVRSQAVKQFDLYDFLIFVFFFPQLIAGPIVHYREMMPQFMNVDKRPDMQNLSLGLCIFAFGIFKKVVLADGVAQYVPETFDSASGGHAISFFSAWMAAIAYTLQIYFDFSGYSDMAIGLARLFGIKLPMNFNSPLKASSIIDFWSRWHITLTRFLTAYVYTPLVMSLTRSRMQRGLPVMGRKRPTLQAFVVLLAWPTVFTMLLSGFWHGAGFTFIAWGGLHGLYLVVNHGWRQWRPKWDKGIYERVMKPVGFVITFSCVVVGMVLFRAPDIESANNVLRGMAGLDGFTIPQAIINRAGQIGQWIEFLGINGDMSSGSVFAASIAWIASLLLIALAMPNVLEIMSRYQPALYFDSGRNVAGAANNRGRVFELIRQYLTFSWSVRWAIALAFLFVLGTIGLSRPSEFLYWQF